MEKKLYEETLAKIPPQKMVSSLQPFYVRIFMSREKGRLTNHFVGIKAKG